MSEAVADLSLGIRLSDPKPSRCASCWKGADADTRFVDFDSAIDRGSFVDPSSMAVIDTVDDLHLCEACVKAACEALAIQPESRQRLLRELQRRDLVIDYFKERVKRLEADLENERSASIRRLPEPVVSPKRPARRAA